jgi:hypothetical protein
MELGDQVAKMRVIYATATSVIVWLGEATGPVGSAFSLIDNLSKNMKDHDAIREILQSQDSAQALDSLAEIFRRDYWSRVWVIQEVHFARSVTVQCAEYKMPLESLVDVRNALVEKFLDTLDHISQERFETSKHIKYLRHAIQFRGPRSLVLDRENHSRGPGQIDLFEGLMMHRLKRATDSRDKIYAMVGFTKAADDPEFVIDYKLSMEQVFINTVDYVLQKSESLDIILAQTKRSTKGNLPTWIPDFGSPGWHDPVPFRHAVLHSAYRASAALKAEANIDNKGGVLTARGISIASVGSIAASIKTYHADDLDNGIATVNSWKEYILHKFSHSPKRLKELARLLLCDLPESLDSTTGSTLLHILDLFDQDPWLDNSDWNPLLTESKRSAEEKKSRSGVQAILHGIFKRNLFVTEIGDLGMAQDSILEGDLVCVLFGCSIPIILRKLDGHFIYISDACVVGYMYGKGIEELAAGKFQVETFKIH